MDTNVLNTGSGQYDGVYIYQLTPKQQFEAQFMKNLSNTEAELKESVGYKKSV